MVFLTPLFHQLAQKKNLKPTTRRVPGIGRRDLQMAPSLTAGQEQA